MKVIFIPVEGESKEITPENGKRFTLKELQALVGGIIQYVTFPDGTDIMVNDEGKLIDLPVNPRATKLWNEQFPLKEYPGNNDGIIVGNAVHFIDYAHDQDEE